ncbi:C-C motif chemokine 25b [Corythoichthys intestinalis]|uniref:C-C motif chemokine 25b n=1 Tax=Corythoichthys intestinalis TaxID=161448 RepID=UPI0025A68027|nr:C-C motif chemokine 25b [Corythoichthys intestinalis]
MKFQALLLLVLIICTTLCVAQDDARGTGEHSRGSPGTYGNCCLGHVRRVRPQVKQNIESFRMQETDGDCNIRAVVFTVKKRPEHKTQRTICANPDHPWVQDLKEAVRQRMLAQN